jgi:uncharacterized membrane protein
VDGPETSPAPILPLPIRLNVLLVLTVLTAVYCAAILFNGLVWLTVPLGLLTLLFTPGYGLVAIVVGERSRWPWYLSTIVIVGLSVAFNVAIGLLLVDGRFGILPLVLAVAALILLFLGCVAQFARSASATDNRFVTLIRSEMGLAGFSPAQRLVGYAILVAIIVVIGGMVYVASVNPREKPDVSFGVTGPEGSSTNLPIGFPTNTSTILVVDIGNNASYQAWTLQVWSNATKAGNSSETPFIPAPVANQSIPWSAPLYLGDGTVSHTSLGTLSPNEMISVNVSVQFNNTITNKPGSFTDYTITFELIPTGSSTPVREASWFLEIKYPLTTTTIASSGGPWP